VRTVRTTSLTVPPNAFLMRLKSLSSLRIVTSRRCGPIGTLSGVAGAGFRPAHATSATPSTASRATSSEAVGCVAASSARPASENGSRASPRTPRAASATPLGSGCGTHGSPSNGSCVGTGSASKRTVARSTPAIPSTSA
jgi:hypothetical protein